MVEARGLGACLFGCARIGDWSFRYPSVSLPSKRPTVCPTSNGEISSEGSCTSTGGRHDRVFVPYGPVLFGSCHFRDARAASAQNRIAVTLYVAMGGKAKVTSDDGA